MPNQLFIKQLQNLRHNRFFAQQLSKEDYLIFYKNFLDCFCIKNNQINKTTGWYLIGTDGCHLCDDAQNILFTAQKTHPLITFTTLDLADAHEWFIDEIFMLIPFLITPKTLLCYPFGVMDIVFLEDY